MDVKSAGEFYVDLSGTYAEYTRLANVASLLDSIRFEAEMAGQTQRHSQHDLNDLRTRMVAARPASVGQNHTRVTRGEADTLREGVSIAYARLAGTCALDGGGVMPRLRAERDLYKGLFADFNASGLYEKSTSSLE